jgi:energy-coupling factor transport system permease protein
MIYKHRSTPLHAARATVGMVWCGALMLAVLLATNPTTLVIVALSGLVAARLAGVGGPVLRATLFMLPLAIGFALINAIVARQGLTVVFQLGDLGPFGQGDVTLEALVYGLIFGLRLVAIVIPSALFASAVDPDQLLRAVGRFSLRSALGATMATRLVPTLAADARRLDEARRLRPVAPRGGRVVVLRAVTAGALDRALDVAATLELRGFSTQTAKRRQGERRPWSRQDWSFAASAAALVALTAAIRVAELGSFEAYPLITGSLSTGVLPGLALAAAALLPFTVTRGVG